MLLIYPNSAVVIEVLKGCNLDRTDLAIDLVGLLICAIDDVKHEVAKAIWRSEYEPDFLFNVLGNRGMFFFYWNFRRRRQKAALILREHCPKTRIEWFRKKALDLFGPSIAGATIDKSKVKLKKKYTKQIEGSRFVGTYEVPPSKEEARKFLNSYAINKEYFYVEVETPEGPPGKDRTGMY